MNMNFRNMALASLLGAGGAGGLMYGVDNLYNKFKPEPRLPWYLTPGGSLALGAGLGAGMGAGAGMLYGPAVGAGLGGITGGVAGYYGNKLLNQALLAEEQRLVNPYFAAGGSALGGIAGAALGALGKKGGMARMAIGAGLGGLTGGTAAGLAGGDVLGSSRGYNPYVDKVAISNMLIGAVLERKGLGKFHPPMHRFRENLALDLKGIIDKYPKIGSRIMDSMPRFKSHGELGPLHYVMDTMPVGTKVDTYYALQRALRDVISPPFKW